MASKKKKKKENNNSQFDLLGELKKRPQTLTILLGGFEPLNSEWRASTRKLSSLVKSDFVAYINTGNKGERIYYSVDKDYNIIVTRDAAGRRHVYYCKKSNLIHNNNFLVIVKGAYELEHKQGFCEWKYLGKIAIAPINVRFII